MQERIDKYKRIIRDFTAEKETFEKQIIALKTSQTKLEQTVSKLQQENLRSSHHTEELKYTIKGLKDKMSSGLDDSRLLDSRILDDKDLNREKSSDAIIRLEEENRALQEQIDDLWSSTREEIDDLKLKLDLSHKECERYKAEDVLLHEKIKDLEFKLTDLADIGKHEDLIEENKLQLLELGNEYNKLIDQVELMEKREQEFAQVNEDLKAEADFSKEKLNALEIKLKEYEDKVNELVSQGDKDPVKVWEALKNALKGLKEQIVSGRVSENEGNEVSTETTDVSSTNDRRQ